MVLLLVLVERIPGQLRREGVVRKLIWWDLRLRDVFLSNWISFWTAWKLGKELLMRTDHPIELPWVTRFGVEETRFGVEDWHELIAARRQHELMILQNALSCTCDQSALKGLFFNGLLH